MAGKFFYRLRLFVGGNSCYVSHNDQTRVLSRALVRAQLPVNYTYGFSPRPLLSFGPARPTGYGSLSEFVDLCAKVEFRPEEIMTRINCVLPAGFSVLSVKRIDGSEFGEIVEKVISSKVGVIFSDDKEPDVVLKKLNEAVQGSGKFTVSKHEEDKFFEILERAFRNAKIPFKREGRLAVFQAKSPQKTAPRIDRPIKNIEDASIRKSLKGLYILDYEFKE